MEGFQLYAGMNKVISEQLSEHCDAVWGAVTSVPGVGVAIVDGGGQIVYANAESNRLLRGEDTEDPTGRELREVFPAEYVTERMTIIQQVLRTGKPILLRHISHGVQLESAMHPVGSGEGLVLVITRQGESGEHGSEFEVFESEFADLGPLSVLSPRELEVLALIGKGMRIAEIAEALYRSPKTVENHRASIGRKLGVTRRTELARLAHRAGLKPEDAKRRRYSRAG